MKEYFIYKYTWPDGHIYIGKSKHGATRFGAKKTYKLCPLIYNYWNKHGDPRQEIVEDNLSLEEINSKEQYYIQFFHSLHTENSLGLNLTAGGDGGNIIGLKTKKQKEIIYNKRRDNCNKKGIYKQSSIDKKRFYAEHPEKCKQISDSLKQYYQDYPEVLQQMSQSRKGRHLTPDQEAYRISRLCRGEQNSRSHGCVCLDTGEKFASSSDAARKYGGSYKVIWKCCKGQCKTAAGHHWCFIEDYK